MMDSLAITKWFDAGVAAWPGVRVERTDFERHARESAERLGPAKAEHAADLYIAAACALRVPRAIEAFGALYDPSMARAIGRVVTSPATVDEALQLTRVKLFVDDPPKIAAYGGQSKMATWLNTVAVRTALNLRGGREVPRGDEMPEKAASAKLGPELEYLRGRYKGAFEVAIVASLGRLSDKERALLRLHLVERMSVDRLGALYNVGRSTAARWLAAAREALFDETKRELSRQLGLGARELESIAGALQSEIHVSVVRLLQQSHA